MVMGALRAPPWEGDEEGDWEEEEEEGESLL
jgi:hypothetical protein